MCGICGIYDVTAPAGLLPDVLRMGEIVQHRGPDDHGWLAVNRNGDVASDRHRSRSDMNGATIQDDIIFGLGHRRLSIIDLSPAGHQPMSDASGRWWIVYNGEVYNHVELRRELANRDREFRSKTDSEVVLQAFIEWGPECLARFNGMWAFAIYDCQTGNLFCARDRFGIKPFYYAGERGRFAFGSECKQLVALPWVGSEANRSQLADCFLWGLENHTSETFFSRILSLPGSHHLSISREDLQVGRFKPNRYWSPNATEYGGEEKAIGEFRDLMFDSVRLRLRSDVPVGVTLSGGLDSSSIVCIAGEHRRLRGDQGALDSFNVEFDRDGYSERRFAEAAAGQAGAKFIVLRPDEADLARDWSRFIWHIEQPFGGLSYFSNYQIYGLIRQHGIPVVLSGQGGDELLLGYERYRVYDSLFNLKSCHLLQTLTNSLSAKRHANMPFSKQLAYGLYFSIPWLRAARRRKLVGPILRRSFFREFKDHKEHLIRSMLHKDRFDLQKRELFHYQLPHLLRHEDRMSMAHSVETRLPFLDYRLLELVLGTPTSLLFRRGWSKYILRQAMDGVLPEIVRWRTDKMGYETPTGSLIRQNRQVFLPLLLRHRDDPVLDIPAIERRFDSDGFDERLLCCAVSYLSWKETFSVS